MAGVVAAIIGALVYGMGAPSKSGRKGEWSIAITWIGLLLIAIGGILAWQDKGVVFGGATAGGGLLLAIMVNSTKK